MTMQPRNVVSMAFLLTVLAYALGLGGPFIFDDGANFAQLQRWLDGQGSLREAIFGTGSGILNRPIAHLSFLINALGGGINPFTFKLINIVIHVGCGALVWSLLRRILARDRVLSVHAEWIAALAAAIWLLHPIHVSTVLYAVQRMAQLSALFALTALWVYVYARELMIDGKTRRAGLLLFLLLPLVFAAGLLSKENAAVAPALCLVVELAWFRDRKRPASILAWHTLFVAIPVAVALIALLAKPDLVLSGYASRDFTLEERVLSQFRALVAYIGQILAPRPWQMGLYSDDFALSTSLWSPATTLPAVVTVAAVSVASFLLRARLPILFFGWFFFLVAHAVESTVVPLELYFEHRNYLPSVGLIAAVVGLVVIALVRADRGSARSLRIGGGVGLLALALLAVATASQARVWGSLERMAAQGVRHHPFSLRANLDAATAALQSGRLDEAEAAMRRLDRPARGGNQMIGRLGQISIECLRSQRAEPRALQDAVAVAPPRINLAEVQALTLLARIQADTNCAGLDPGMVGEAIVAVLDATQAQPATSAPHWRLRMNAATLFGNAGRPRDALAQARLAWQPTADVGVGTVLVQAAAAAGELDEARRTLDEMLARTAPGDANTRAQIEALRAQLPAASPAPDPAD
jgi:hypothetical protein